MLKRKQLFECAHISVGTLPKVFWVLQPIILKNNNNKTFKKLNNLSGSQSRERIQE